MIEDIRFLDWQLIRYVSPAIDLAGFLFTSIDKPIRDKEYENLLRIYYESLSKTVTLLGSGPIFTFDDLQDELKKYAVFVLILAPMVFQTTQATSSESLTLDEIGNRMAEGENRQELITGLSEDAQKVYERRLNEVFEEIIDKLGYYHILN